MSLIYAALSALDAPTGQAASAAPAPLPAPVLARPSVRRLLGAGVGLLLLAGAGALWFAGRAAAPARDAQLALKVAPVAPPAPASVPTPAAVMLPDAPPPLPVAVAVATPLPTPSLSPSTTATPSQTPSPSLVPTPMPSPDAARAVAAMPPMTGSFIVNRDDTAAPAPAQRSRAHAAPSVARAPATAEGAAPSAEPDPQLIDTLVRDTRLAIDAGRQDQARALLAQLSTRLPADSITLLKLRAWQAMRGAEPAQATAMYRQIVARLPDDQTSAINLLILLWRDGHQDEARRMLAGLVERYPDSDTVQQLALQLAPR